MGNSLTWTEFHSTFQIYLNLNLRAKLREWKLDCQKKKNSVNPKGTQIAKYSTALKDISSPLIWASWLAPLHSKMNPRLKLYTMNSVGVGENIWEWNNTSCICEGSVLRFCIWMLKDFGQEQLQDDWSRSPFLYQIESLFRWQFQSSESCPSLS